MRKKQYFCAANEEIGANNKENYRDLSLPMSVQQKENLKCIIDQYNYEEDDGHKCYFKVHYSNSSYITLYLFRINPYTNNQIKLQRGKFDNPNRQIASLQSLCDVFKGQKETCELIPEYFYFVEGFLNNNYTFYGFLNAKMRNIVNNFKLTEGFDSFRSFFAYLRVFLN